MAETPFQRVVDDLTDGCGCACHTGLGYRSSCEHCPRMGLISMGATAPIPSDRTGSPEDYDG
jgi:hypothetical protein